MYTECREGNLGNQPLPEGSGSKGTEALGQWGAGEGTSPSPWAPTPVRHIPSRVMWGQQERSRGFRWILVEDSRGALAEEPYFSRL